MYLGASSQSPTLPNAKWHFLGQHGASSRRGGYQSILCPAVLPLCKIGYCPMIEGSCTDLTTVYAVLKHPQMVDDVLELYLRVRDC